MKLNKLILRNVFGKPVNINTEGGVTKVDSLPEEGEAGKIYYNTTTDVYYVYDTYTNDYTVLGQDIIPKNSLPDTGEAGKIYYNTTDGIYYVPTDDGWIELTPKEMKVVSQNVVSGLSHIGRYTIVPNTLYDTGYMTFELTSQGGNIIPKLHITLTGYKDGIAASYVFRQTIPNGTANIIIAYPNDANRTVIIPDKTKEILENLESGHTYEFNILHDVVMVADITKTENPIIV